VTPRVLAMRYVAFAVVATVANLAVQRMIFAATGAASVLPPALSYCVALLAGTLIGLIIKYILDKRWIFYDRASGVDAYSKQFSLYVLMGVATTAIFWGTETVFWLLSHSQIGREIGATIGLSVGYIVKYRLDRRFVFGRDGGKARNATW